MGGFIYLTGSVVIKNICVSATKIKKRCCTLIPFTCVKGREQTLKDYYLTQPASLQQMLPISRNRWQCHDAPDLRQSTGKNTSKYQRSALRPHISHTHTLCSAPCRTGCSHSLFLSRCPVVPNFFFPFSLLHCCYF